MLSNTNYNIMETITIISKSLYRYDAYIQDASKCETCRKMWLAFRKQREAELATLLIELKKHIGEEKLSEPEFPERFEWTQALI